jgi:hypothetical protein
MMPCYKLAHRAAARLFPDFSKIQQVNGYVGLKELASLKNLRRLHLIGTGVTDAGVTLLREALPHCMIEYVSRE